VDEECPTGSFDAKQLPVLELYSIRDGGEEKSNEKMLIINFILFLYLLTYIYLNFPTIDNMKYIYYLGTSKFYVM